MYRFLTPQRLSLLTFQIFKKAPGTFKIKMPAQQNRHFSLLYYA